MKLICKTVLAEHGFTELPENAGPDIIMEKEKFKLTLKSDGSCQYSNLGIQYPIKDLAGLKKLYKEITCKELNELKLKSY